MNDRYVTEKLLEDFSSQLRAAGCAQGTAENYLLHVRAFARWLEGGEATGEAAAGWRCWLLEQGYGPPSVNGMLVAPAGTAARSCCAYSGARSATGAAS